MCVCVDILSTVQAILEYSQQVIYAKPFETPLAALCSNMLDGRSLAGNALNILIELCQVGNQNTTNVKVAVDISDWVIIFDPILRCEIGDFII